MGQHYDGDDTRIKGGTDETYIGNIGDRLKVVDEDKARLQLGQAFALGIQYVLNDAQTVYHSFKTPDTATRIHLNFKTYSSNRTQIALWENPTGVVYNFPWTGRNRNRASGGAPTAVIQAVSTVTSPGTLLLSENNYGSGLTVSESQVLFLPDFILAQNTEYLIGMQSYAASNLTTVQLRWYEI